MNVGFKETLRFGPWDCFIFHDVDYLPMNAANYYGCDQFPRYFVGGEEKHGWKLEK